MGPEAKLERKLVERVKRAGGVAYKFTSPARRSVPDRLCVFPGAKLVFVEVKAPGRKPTEKQAREIARLRSLGFKVLVCDSEEAIEEALPLGGGDDTWRNLV